MSAQLLTRARPSSAARQGARAAAAYAVAFAPYGLIIGALAQRSEVGRLAGWSSAWLLYGGTSQVIAIHLVDSGTAVAVIVLTIALFNVRVVAYAIAVAPRWGSAPRWWIAIASYVLIDPAYVIADERWSDDDDPTSDERLDWHRRYYLGAAVTLWATWVVVCGAGVLAGTVLASALPARFVAQLMLVTMVAIVAREPDDRLAAGLGFAFGALTVAIPGRIGPVLSAIAAVAAVRAIRRRRP